MNPLRLLKRLPLWGLIPAWFFVVTSLVFGLTLFTAADRADFAIQSDQIDGTLIRWILGEVALLFCCITAGAALRVRVRQQIAHLATRVARIPYAAPESFLSEVSAEEREFGEVLSSAARYVQDRLAASAKSEQQARRIVDSNIIGMAMWRQDGLLIDANDAFLRIIGYSRADLQCGSLRWDKITPGEYLPLDNRALEEIRIRGSSIPFEKEYIHRAGHRVSVLVAGASTDSSGTEGICFALDRTDAKRTHASLTRRIELEHLVASFAAQIISLPSEQLSSTMNQALAEFGTLAGIDGAVVFLFDAENRQLLKEYEWHSQAHTPDAIITKPSSAVLRSIDRLCAGETVQGYSLPEGLASQTDSNTSIRSEVNVPLIYSGTLAGVLTLHLFRDDRNLSNDDLTLFRLLGQMIASALSRLRADQALKESRETKRAVWDTSLDGIITMDSSGCIRDWNPAAEKIFGYTPEEVVGEQLSDKIVPKALRMQHQLGLRRFLTTRKSTIIGSRMEIQAIRKNGDEFSCELSISPVQRGSETIFIGTVRDITDRRRNEEQLRASQSALEHAVKQTRSVLDALPVHVALFDSTGEIVITNHVWSTKGQPDWMQPEHANSAAGSSPVHQRILDVAAGKANNFTLEYSAHSGAEKRWFRVVATPLGECTRGAVVMHMDITEHQLAVEALADSEQRYRSLVDNAREAIFSLSPDGIVKSLNPAFTEITGHPCEQWIGSKIDGFLHPSDVEKAKNLFARVLAGETAQPFTLRAIHADGRELEFECTAVPRRIEGTVVGLLGVARDVTERNRLEEKLRQAERMDSIGQLAAGVAHDFNNILTIQQSYASELAELSALPEAAREAIAEITEAGERAAVLTRKLLAFGRRQAMQPRLLNCVDFLRGMHRSIERVLGDDIAYTLSPSAGLPSIYIDADMLEQVVTILVSNAHDAMPDGGALVISTEHLELAENSIRTNPEARPGSFVRLTVTDTGCGISPENLQHIFEPFFTTKDVARGSGLGLATIHGIIKQNNGWIEVDSRLHAGTTFRIYLPAVQSPPPAAIAPPAKAPVTRSDAQETILVVEDEAQLCTVVGHFLKRRGYHVLTAGSGIEALKLWEEHGDRIDLLLTDLVMPEGMTGKELADRLLAQRPDLKVLYTSGYSSEVAGRDLSLQAGFNFLPKPYQPAVLAKVVRECLDKA